MKTGRAEVTKETSAASEERNAIGVRQSRRVKVGRTHDIGYNCELGWVRKANLLEICQYLKQVLTKKVLKFSNFNIDN